MSRTEKWFMINIADPSVLDTPADHVRGLGTVTPAAGTGATTGVKLLGVGKADKANDVWSGAATWDTTYDTGFDDILEEDYQSTRALASRSGFSG